MSPPFAASSLSELSRAASANGSVPPSICCLRVSAHSTSVGKCITWMTCQPNADLTGSSSCPGSRPGLWIAAANAGSTASSVEKYGSLPPLVRAALSSLSARASESNSVGSAWSFA